VPAEPTQRPGDNRVPMPAPADDDPPRCTQVIARSSRQRPATGVVAPASLQVQVVRDDQPVTTTPLRKVSTEEVADLTAIPYATTVHNVHFSPDGSKVIAAGVDRRATIWNVPSGVLALTLDGIADEMADAAFSPDGRLIATTGTNYTVKVWDAATGALRQTMTGHDAYVSHAVWIGSDRFVTNDWGGSIRSWVRDATGVLVGTVRADAFCHSMVRSLVGALLAVGEGQRPVHWPREVLAGAVRLPDVHVVAAHGLTLEEVSYPPDSELAARAALTRGRRELTTP